MSRPKHQVSELETIPRKAESGGWRAEKGKKYFPLYCPCGNHQRSVHLTPSNPNYALNLRKWLQRQPCWREETQR